MTDDTLMRVLNRAVARGDLTDAQRAHIARYYDRAVPLDTYLTNHHYLTRAQVCAVFAEAGVEVPTGDEAGAARSTTAEEDPLTTRPGDTMALAVQRVFDVVRAGVFAVVVVINVAVALRPDPIDLGGAYAIGKMLGHALIVYGVWYVLYELFRRTPSRREVAGQTRVSAADTDVAPLGVPSKTALQDNWMLWALVGVLAVFCAVMLVRDRPVTDVTPHIEEAPAPRVLSPTALEDAISSHCAADPIATQSPWSGFGLYVCPQGGWVRLAFEADAVGPLFVYVAPTLLDYDEVVAGPMSLAGRDPTRLDEVRAHLITKLTTLATEFHRGQTPLRFTESARMRLRFFELQSGEPATGSDVGVMHVPGQPIRLITRDGVAVQLARHSWSTTFESGKSAAAPPGK